MFCFWSILLFSNWYLHNLEIHKLTNANCMSKMASRSWQGQNSQNTCCISLIMWCSKWSVTSPPNGTYFSTCLHTETLIKPSCTCTPERIALREGIWWQLNLQTPNLEDKGSPYYFYLRRVFNKIWTKLISQLSGKHQLSVQACSGHELCSGRGQFHYILSQTSSFGSWWHRELCFSYDGQSIWSATSIQAVIPVN